MKLPLVTVLFSFGVHGKVFPISWDPKICLLVACDVVKNYVSYINGTLNYTNCKNDCEFDIYFNITHRYKSSFYFYEYNHIKIIQPNNPSLQKEFYMFMPFHWKVWVLVFGSIFYLTAVVKLVSYLENVSSSRAGWSKSFLIVIQTLSSAGATFRRTRTVTNFIYFLIIFYAFMLSIMYSAFLGSCLLSDIRKLPILCPSIFFDSDNRDEYALKFKLVSMKEFAESVAKMEPSYGFCVTPPFIDLTKKHVDHKFYRMHTSITMDLWTPIHFFKEKDPMLADSYGRFLGHIYSSGLVNHWRFRQFLGYLFTGYAKLSQEFKEYTALSINEFSVPFGFLFGGLIVGFMCFLGEIGFLGNVFSYFVKKFKKE